MYKPYHKQSEFKIGDWIIANETYRENHLPTNARWKKKYRARKILGYTTDEYGRHNISFMTNHMEMLAHSKNFRLATEEEIKIEKIKLIFKIPSKGIYT